MLDQEYEQPQSGLIYCSAIYHLHQANQGGGGHITQEKGQRNQMQRRGVMGQNKGLDHDVATDETLTLHI